MMQPYQSAVSCRSSWFQCLRAELPSLAMIPYRLISIRKSECFFSGRENLSFKLTTASIERVSVGGKSGRGDPLLMIIHFSSLFPTLPLFFAPELFFPWRELISNWQSVGPVLIFWKNQRTSIHILFCALGFAHLAC